MKSASYKVLGLVFIFFGFFLYFYVSFTELKTPSLRYAVVIFLIMGMLLEFYGVFRERREGGMKRDEKNKIESREDMEDEKKENY